MSAPVSIFMGKYELRLFKTFAQHCLFCFTILALKTCFPYTSEYCTYPYGQYSEHLRHINAHLWPCCVQMDFQGKRKDQQLTHPELKANHVFHTRSE